MVKAPITDLRFKKHLGGNGFKLRLRFEANGWTGSVGATFQLGATFGVGRCGGIEKTSLISLTPEERRTRPHMAASPG
jgi:hypothetical protein